MEHTDYYTEQQADWNRHKIMPGISDNQMIKGRVNGEEIENTKEESFTGTAKKEAKPSSEEDKPQDYTEDN
jgi:hypothetical protein